MDAELKKNLLLSIAAVALFFLAFEIVLRFLYITPPSELYVPDKYLERRLAPDYATTVIKPDFTMRVRTNSLGLRGGEIGPKQAGVKRILVLGDSYPFGFGVQEEEAFPEKLGEYLRNHGKQVQAVNAGVFGWSPDQELLWLEREGLPLGPDVVVIAFYVGNDVADSMDKKFFALEGGKLRRIKPLLSDDEMKGLESRSWLRKNVFVYAFLSEKIRTVLAAFRGGVDKPVNEFEMLQKDYPPELEEGRALSEAILAEMVRATRAAGAEPVLVVIPSELQYGQGKWLETARKFGLNESGFDFGKPDRRLQAFAAGNGVPYVDLLPAMAEENRNQGLHLPLDGHWNARGHELAAVVLGEALLRQGLV